MRTNDGPGHGAPWLAGTEKVQNGLLDSKNRDSPGAEGLFGMWSGQGRMIQVTCGRRHGGDVCIGRGQEIKGQIDFPNRTGRP